MSLLGKKRTKRSKEDDEVRKKILNIIYNIIQEFEKIAGIKEEDNIINEEEKKENKQINQIEEKKEEKNDDIKIIENTINIPSTERIKNTTIKKEPKNKGGIDNSKDKSKIDITLLNKEKEKDNNINFNKKEIKEDIKQETTKNPFALLVDNNNDKNENNKNNNKEKSIFDNVINNNKNKSLFGDIINKDKDKDNEKEKDDNNNKKENKPKSLFDFPNKEEKNEKEQNTKTNQGSLFANNSIFTNTSLFGNNPGKSLFDTNNDNNNNQKSLFGDYAGKSLFGNNDNNNNNKNTPSLFSDMNIPKNPFSEIKGDDFAKSLFNNNNTIENKKESNIFAEGDENSENSDENDKPQTKYVAEPLKAQDYSEYSKLINLNVNNLFLYNKTDKKYISKGSGYFSIEKTKDEKSDKHQAVVVFRNHAGNKLAEGFLDKKFNKFDILSKEFNYVVCFGIIMVNEGKPEIGFIKIPFKNEDIANELKKKFEEAMEFINKK